jgi:hypothetical protein
MTYTIDTPIKGQPRGTPELFIDFAKSKGSKRIDEVIEYIETIYRLAPILGFDPAILIGQSILETSLDGVPWASPVWTERLNPAGIGWTGDPEQNAASRVFGSGEEAAKAQLVHMWAYVNGSPNIPGGLVPLDSPRWGAVERAGWLGTVDVIGDLTNKWAADGEYGEKIVQRLNQFNIGGTSVAHKFILSAGHRNTNRGGARNEINWTYPSVVALKAAIIARGGEAWIVQEEDGDGDKSFYVNGGLQQAAQKCVSLAKTLGPFGAYISSHYNGGGSPGFHAIFPDSTTGGVDVKANNPLDVRLARRMRDAVKATNTVGMLSWTADSPGVMSERETGVGSQGYRLGEMYGTIGFRDTTARVIIEAGSIDVAREAAYINDPKWVRYVYAEAIVDALEAEFGDFGGTPTTPPPTNYDPFSPEPKLQEMKDRPSGTVPLYVKINNVWWHKTFENVTVVNKTPRLQYAGSGNVGPDFEPGEIVFVGFDTIVNDQPVGYVFNSGGDGARIRLSDTDFGVAQ